MPTSRPQSPFSARRSAIVAVFVGFSLVPTVYADNPQSNEAAPTAFNSPGPTPSAGWGTGDARSFWVPAVEIPSFQLLLNRFDHYAIDAHTYPAPWTNLRRNLHR